MKPDLSVLHSGLELTKPLIALDLETTGTHKNIDRIVQIGVVKLTQDGAVTTWETLVNPTIPIPPEATAVHKITDEMVANAPTFKDLAPGLAAGFYMVDWCGFNINFDLSMLEAEFRRLTQKVTLAGRVLDASDIYRRYFPRTLVDAVREYLGETHSDAHGALPDAIAAIRVVQAQLARHTDLPRSIENLHVLLRETPKDGHVDSEGKLYWRFGEAHFNFGKYAGHSLQTAVRDRGYMTWVLTQDFSLELKSIIEAALKGEFPKK